MSGEANVDEQRLSELAEELAEGVEAALQGWVEQSVGHVLAAWTGGTTVDEPTAKAAAEAGERATEEVGGRIRALLATDVDQQRTNPMSILRAAVSYPTEVLRAAGVPPLVRDREAQRQFPDDDYDLTPTNFADIDETLRDPGLAWGAAKAFIVKRRRADEGRS